MQNSSNSRRSSFRVAAALGALLLGAAFLSPAMAAAPKKAADPFSGDVWHAQSPSWPGTMVFDGATKKVTLTPVGAAQLEVGYTYTINSVSAKGANTDISGKLSMKSKDGQVSDSNFVISGKTLKMQFSNTQREEHYVRMTTAEQEAAKADLLKRLTEKGITPGSLNLKLNSDIPR